MLRGGVRARAGAAPSHRLLHAERRGGALAREPVLRVVEARAQLARLVLLPQVALVQPVVRRVGRVELLLQVRGAALERLALGARELGGGARLALRLRLRLQQRLALLAQPVVVGAQVVDLLHQLLVPHAHLRVLALHPPHPLEVGRLGGRAALAPRRVGPRACLRQRDLLLDLELAHLRAVLVRRGVERRLVLLGLAAQRREAGARLLELGLECLTPLAPRRLRVLDQPEPHRLEVGRRDHLLAHVLKLPRRLLELGGPARALRVELALLPGPLPGERVVLPPRLVALLLEAERLHRERLDVRAEAVALLGHVVEHGAQRVDLLLERHVAHEQELGRQILGHWGFELACVFTTRRSHGSNSMPPAPAGAPPTRRG